MNLKTAIAIAVAGAFAMPLAVQASADADRVVLAQSTGAPVTPKAEAGATAKGGFAAIDKNGDGHISRDEAKDAPWENRFSELDQDNDNRLSRSEFEAMQAGAGASGSTGAPVTSGGNAPDRKPGTPKQ